MDNFKKYLPEIEFEIQGKIKKSLGEVKPFCDMANYAFGVVDDRGRKIDNVKFRGKRFRSLLCLLVSESICGKYKHALPIAALIEVFHNFSLVHDDIEDNDKKRRFRKSVWSVWGVPHAINIGDAMLVLSCLPEIEPGKNFSERKLLKIISILNKCFLEVIKGQYLDISFEERENISDKEYLSMIKRKTAILIATSCQIGAELSTDNNKTINYYKDFGLNLGLAFQIHDDICGMWEESQLGKKGKGDIKKKKKTLPFIYALKKLNKKDKSQFLKIYKKKSIDADDVKKIYLFLDKINARSFCEIMAMNCKKEAIDILNKLSIKKHYKDEISELVNKLININ